MFLEKSGNDPIITIKLEHKGESWGYGKIEYSDKLSWTELDKKKIEETIVSIKNKNEKDGKESVSTSIGEVILTYELHPENNRFKHVLGFIKISNGSIAISNLLKEIAPASLKDKERANEYLSLLDKEISSDEISLEKFRAELFSNAIQSLKKVFSADAGSERIDLLLDMIATFSKPT